MSTSADEVVLLGSDELPSFDDNDIAQLLQGATPVEDPHTLGPSEELQAVAHRIAAQYLEMLSQVAAMLFSGREHEGMLEQLDATLEALQRLAKASEADLEHKMLSDLRGWTAEYSHTHHDLHGRTRGRTRYLDRLRTWLPQYAALLGPEIPEHLRNLTDIDLAKIPLFEELEAIRGVGPKRLRRMYLAGLHTVDAVCAADPRDLAQVTGLPLGLARDIVERSQEYAESRRRVAVVEMRSRLAEFMGVVQQIQPDQDPELHAAALRALHEMSAVVRNLLREG